MTMKTMMNYKRHGMMKTTTTLMVTEINLTCGGGGDRDCGAEDLTENGSGSKCCEFQDSSKLSSGLDRKCGSAKNNWFMKRHMK